MCRDKIQDMYVGQEFKNYKEMCIWLGESIKSGCSKKAQIKEWKCNFNFDIIRNKIRFSILIELKEKAYSC